MEEKYIVFDVETPNTANDRICSVGISEIENGKIIQVHNYYVNPECGFDLRNIKIHGINERDVIHAETFPQIWSKIRSLFFDRVVIAHNAQFDLSVLKKTLASYGIIEQNVYYLDTINAAHEIYPNLPNFKLDTICDYLGICLEHHNSGSDCKATAEVFLDMCYKGLQIYDYVQPYSLNGCGCEKKIFSHKSRLSAESYALLDLQSILEEIIDDGRIDLEEMACLQNWIEKHTELAGNYPYDAVYHQIKLILEDGIIEEKELGELLKVCHSLINPIESRCACSQFPIDIKGKNIVLSGTFSSGSKSEVEARLVLQGAIIQKAVTSKTHIVLVGNEGNNTWVAGNYGTKVKKAMEMQAKGLKIEIIKENDFFRNEG